MPSEEEREELLSHHPHGNIGLPFGPASGLCAIDIDTTDEELVAAIEDCLPHTPWRRVGAKGCARIFRWEGQKNFKIRDESGMICEFLGLGNQLVLPPSIHPDTGKPYVADSNLWEVIDAIPKLGVNIEEKLRDMLGHSRNNRAIPKGARHPTLTSEAGRMRNRGLSGNKLRKALVEFNQRNCQPPLPADEVEDIVAWADTIEGGDGLPLTELGNARRLVRAFDGNALFVREENEWRVWNGTRWVADTDGYVERCAKRVADELLSGAGEDKERHAAARRAQTARGIRAMIDLARTEPGVPISAACFDRDCDVLNTPSGIVDLRSGKLGAPNRDALHSKSTATPLHHDAECSTWERVIEDVFVDEEVASAFQRIAGYWLSGRTDEQKIFIASGTGANAKSLMTNILAEALGEFARHTPMATFLQRRTDAATNDLAALNGTRLVIANEGNPGQKLDTALVKSMTGGDPITARRLYRDFVTFTPHFKPLIVSNHLPEIDGNDPAIWRRIFVIPFPRVFAPEEQDPQLPQKLRAELPGILRWAVEGAVAYYREGLNTPPAILQATAAYRSEMDVVGSFIADCCAVAPGLEQRATPLYLAYASYARELGTDIISQTAFGRELGRRNFSPAKKEGVVWRRGIALRPPALGLAA
jgi:putative DNA primase/helicase